MAITRCYDDLTARLEAAARRPAVSLERIGEFPTPTRSYPMFAVRVGRPGPGKPAAMVAAGIHGDEPAGVEAALRFIETNRDGSDLLDRFAFTVFPCNNPTGWEANTRENWSGIDLNRQFAARRPAPEAELIARSLEGRCFDLVFEMHEDVDSHGFYLYEIAGDSRLHIGEAIVEAVESAGFPVNRDDCIEGLPAHGGIIRRSINLKRFRKTRLPQAIYAYRACGGHVLTIEPPASALSFEDRVWIELKGLEIALAATLAASGAQKSGSRNL